jgi:hypothetical protein
MMPPYWSKVSLTDLFGGKMHKKRKMIRLVPGFPVFREAVSAIDRPALSWLEGDFALFSTV